MRAMVLKQIGSALQAQDVPRPVAGDGELLLEVKACGICRTDLHVVDGDLREPALPLIPGHQIVGEIVEIGANVNDFRVGDILVAPMTSPSLTSYWGSPAGLRLKLAA